MKNRKLGWFVALFSLGVLGFNVPVNAAEIIEENRGHQGRQHLF